MNFQLKSIAIVGLGLMGGSLAPVCRKRFPKARIIGISRDRKALALSLRRKWIHEGHENLRVGTSHADLVVLCTPIDTFPKLLKEIDRFARKGTIVTDVGSVKTRLMQWAGRQKFKNITFVSAHPMMGSHERGIQAADPSLYDRGFVFVIRGAKTHSKSFLAIENFWKKVAHRTVPIRAAEHDELVSRTSHLPHAIVVCLMLTVPVKFLKYSGTGLRGATRIAAGHSSIWLPIFEQNRKAIVKAIHAFEKNLRAFKLALQRSQTRKLERMLDQACNRRREITL